MMLWLLAVLVGTAIAGWCGKLPGVEPAPYILRFNEDRPNPLYRRICYTLAWSEVVSYALLNTIGLIDAIVNGTWRMRAIYDAWYLPIAVTMWVLGALGWLPRVGRSTKGEGHGAAVLLRIGVGRLHRAADPVVPVEGAAADADLRRPQARGVLGRARLRRQPRSPRPAAAHAADPARRNGGGRLAPCHRHSGRSSRSVSRVRRRAGARLRSASPRPRSIAPRSCRSSSPAAIDALRAPFAKALARRAKLAEARRPSIETTPGVACGHTAPAGRATRLSPPATGFFAAKRSPPVSPTTSGASCCAGWCSRARVDTRLKVFFSGSEVRYGATPFQGKGFRSLGQEAIYAARASAAPRRRRIATADGGWHGDVIGPIIRDLGAALAMRPEPATVRMVLSAQMGKAGAADGRPRPAHRRFRAGASCPPSAPLAISSLTVAGMGLAFARAASGSRRRVVHRRGRVVARRVARGDQPVRGAAAAGDLLPRRTTRRRSRRRSPTSRPSACSPTRRSATAFPGVTIDGTDPEAIAAAFTWAAERARAGQRPGAHRARRDAHVRPRASRRHALSRQGSAAVVGVPAAHAAGLRRSGAATTFWRARDPIPRLRARARAARPDPAAAISIALKREAEAMVEAEARGRDRRAVAGGRQRDRRRVSRDDPVDRRRVEVLDRDAARSPPPRRRSPSRTRRPSTARARRSSTR